MVICLNVVGHVYMCAGDAYVSAYVSVTYVICSWHGGCVCVAGVECMYVFAAGVIYVSVCDMLCV